jgi:hypothetical protein
VSAPSVHRADDGEGHPYKDAIGGGFSCDARLWVVGIVLRAHFRITVVDRLAMEKVAAA